MSRSKLAIALAIVLGTVSAASAATKHPVHHRAPVQAQQVSAASAYGSAANTSEPEYMAIQTQDSLNSD